MAIFDTAPNEQQEYTVPVQALDTPISINPNKFVEVDTIPLEVPAEEQSAPISPEVIERRATKFKYGLDAILKKSKDEIYESLSQGQEGDLRVQAAAEIDQRKRLQTEKVISHVMGAKGGPLSPAEAFGIQSIINNMNEKTDPSSVLEEGYAKTFMDTFDKMAMKNPESVPAQIRRAAPEIVAAAQAGHGERIMKREFAVTTLENIEAELKDQGYLEYGFDLVKQAVPGYTDYNLRGNVSGTGTFEGGALGPNLEKQRQNLLRLPGKEFKSELIRIVNELKSGVAGGNPQLAAEFVRSVIGMSVDDVFLKSSVLPLDVAGLGLGKMAATGGRKILENSGWVRQTEKAISDIAKEAANPNASKSTIEAAAGDLEAAAVTRATTSLVWDPIGTGKVSPAGQGNRAIVEATIADSPQATVDAIDALSGTLRVDEVNVAAKPGRYGQEIVNRIVESSQNLTTRLFDAVRTISKVERLPEIMANETAVKAILENMRKKYAGLDNSIIDMTRPYKEPISNTYLVDMHLGKNDGTYFKSREVAENFVDFHGLRGAKIIEGKEGKFTPTAVRDAKIDKDIAGAQRIITKNEARANDEALSAEERVKAMEQIELSRSYIAEKEAEKTGRKTFKTSKGSTYEINPDGTTTRTKAERSDPGHKGDYGLKDKSVKTVYLKDPRALGQPDRSTWRFIDHGDGTMSLAVKNHKGEWGISPSQRNIPYTTTPEVGLHPLELWSPEKIKGQSGFKKAHFGNEIVELGETTAAQKVSVEQQGFGFYIKVTKPINETDQVVRQFIAETTNTKIPDGVVQRFLNGSMIGRLRTPEETLSLSERQNRLTATYTPSVYFDLMRQNAPTLNKILGFGTRFGKGRSKRKEFERILKEGQRMKDPDFPDEPAGYFFKDPAELEETYLRIHNRLPDKDEIVAYFEFKRGMEMDRVFRNIAEVRNQQRVGAETHSISTTDESGKVVSSPEFSGVVRTKLSAVDDNILIMGDKAGESRRRSLQNMSKAERDELQKGIDDGEYKFIELYAPEHKPLNGFEGLTEANRIRYVLAKTAETRPLEWNQIPRRGGGHMEYDYDFYIKQAKVSHDDIGSRFWYEGDTTIMPVQVRSMGAKVAEHLNKVRKMLKDNDEAGAMAYSNKYLHMDWDEVKGWFIGERTADGKLHAPRLSLNEPIHVIKKNESIIGVDKELERRYTNFKDGQKEGSLARQNVVEYGSMRDAHELITLADEGTKNNPLYKVAQAELVDPITTMNRGLTRIAKSNFMDDYKTMSVEHWLKQASQYLDATDSEIWHAPFYHYNNPKFKVNAPVEVRRALETARAHTQQLTGTPSTTDALLHSYAQRAYDSLYNNFGPKGLIIDPAWMLPKLKDPFSFVRSVVFNFKMGLWNVPQFIVQAGNYTNIYGLAGPKYATPGTLGAQLHFWSRVNSNPAIINHLDDLASKLNVPGAAKWRRGEFKEAWEELNKTGFGNVGQEYVLLDNPMSEKIVETGGRKFLEWGQYFFKQGERNAKYGAWYTAFKEFRDANPIGRITEADRAGILQRADLLNLNMSRASSSMLHQGALSVPTQFYTYQIRLMELMTSGRISAADKVRLFWVNAAMYGIPMGTGLTGLPLADYMRRNAMDGTYGERYVVGDKFFQSLIMEGIPAMIGAVATGKGDYQAGTFYDVGSRFGTKGLEFVGGLDRKDKSLMDLAGGAAWSVIKGTWEQSDGFRRATMAFIKADQDVYPYTLEDVIDVAKEISTVNTGARLWAASMTGRYISKKESYLADTTVAQQLFQAAFGLKDQRITDIQTMANAIKETKDGEAQAEKQFEQEFKRGLLAMKDDPAQGHKFWTRAKAILELAGYPEDRISDLVNKAIRNNESMVEKMNFDFYLKHATGEKKKSGFEALQRQHELKQKRGE